MKLVIMLCNSPEIEIREISDEINDIEEYIEHELRYNVDELSWQLYHEDITIKMT